jgi:hypothetical protein
MTFNHSEFNKFHTCVFLFVVSNKKVHISVSVASAVLFCNLLYLLDFFFRLSFAFSFSKLVLMNSVRFSIISKHNLLVSRKCIRYFLIFTLRRLNRFLKYLDFLKSSICTINVVVPARDFERMPISFRIISRKYWETLHVILFHKLSNYFSISYYNCFSVKYWVFFIKEVHVLLCSAV